MQNTLITSPIGTLAVLSGIAAFFFFLEKKTAWKLFSFLPPLIFIYALPAVCSNAGLIGTSSPVYNFMGDAILPVCLVLLLLDVNILATIRAMGRGVFVMLAGTVGVILGAPTALFLVKSGLDSTAWKGFAALSGSWIGGTANMAAAAEVFKLDAGSLDFGYAVIADNAVYLVWLPIMLASKNLAGMFARFSGVSDERLKRMEQIAKEATSDKGAPQMRHYLYLIFLAFGAAGLADWVAGLIPPYPPVFDFSAYKILSVTVIGICLSFSPARRIPGSHAFAMALMYLFVARMGAMANLSNISMSVFWFLLGAYIWIFIHGAFLVGAARLFKVDVHTAAISSAANIGGAASAPIVAAFHRPTLVPVSILMALLGYAIGTPAAILTGWLCKLVM